MKQKLKKKNSRPQWQEKKGKKNLSNEVTANSFRMNEILSKHNLAFRF